MVDQTNCPFTCFGRCAKLIFNQWAEKPAQMNMTSGERSDKSAAGSAKTQ
jgi:hypothetical protein